jgi:uncharacterized protein YjiS (DUF1127 family)
MVGVFYYSDIYRCMLREEIYQKTAVEFATPVGVANIIGYKTKAETVKEWTESGFNKLSKDMEINDIIRSAIQSGRYKRLSRGVWKLRKDNRRLSDLGVYRRVWAEIRGVVNI